MKRFGAFARFLWHDHHVALAVVGAATLILSLTEGIGLLMLVPMLRLVGVSLGEGATDELAQRLETVLRGVGIAPTLVGVLVVVVGLVAARAAVQWLLAVQEASLEARVVGRLRERLFSAVVRLPWARFAGERPAALLHTIGPEVDDVHSALLMLMHVASLLATVVAAAVVAVVIAPQLALVVALCGGLLFMAARVLRLPGRAEGEQLLSAAIGLFTRISELLGGLKMVHAHGAEARAVAAVSADSSAWTVLTRRVAGHRARVNFALAVLSVCVLAALVWGSVEMAGVSPAALLLLLLLYARLVPRLIELQRLVSSLSQTMASFDSVLALLARCEATRAEATRAEATRAEATRAEATRAEEGSDEGGNVGGPSADVLLEASAAPAVELRGVTVRYPSSARAALRDVSAHFPAGALTAVVGASGAGKTTLGDVLLGLLAPESGVVLVDGVPLSELSMKRWRSRVGYLSQEPMLFHGTIRENLLFARPEASEDDLRTALRAAACDFVDGAPSGLDAAVGDRGVRLSGGERQRLALARAMLRRPFLLVLDEATSALDAETEARILQTVRALRGRCTVVFCTHRGAVRDAADHVIDLQQPSP